MAAVCRAGKEDGEQQRKCDELDRERGGGGGAEVIGRETGQAGGMNWWVRPKRKSGRRRHAEERQVQRRDSCWATSGTGCGLAGQRRSQYYPVMLVITVTCIMHQHYYPAECA